ncbi:MAG: adenosylcobinamide kinase/adenosylcobinamide-phosphate guanylyltransferase [Myxococcota bacterium]|jgi:adenosylcobinamide kinase/adenosylcobinamide-phosphate guanylyltransferase
MGALIFIGGGARSGKSTLGLTLAERTGPRRVFIATAQAWDDEMIARITRHRDERDDTWHTVEEPLAVAGCIRAQTDCDVVLLDCLTLWLTNLLLAETADIQAHVADLIAAIASAPFDVIVVTNEVGLGIVPANALSRRFRDEAGFAHQALAAAAQSVYFGAMGMLLRLKPGPVEPVL